MLRYSNYRLEYGTIQSGELLMLLLSTYFYLVISTVTWIAHVSCCFGQERSSPSGLYARCSLTTSRAFSCVYTCNQIKSLLLQHIHKPIRKWYIFLLGRGHLLLTLLYYRMISLYRNNIVHRCERTILELHLFSYPLFFWYVKRTQNIKPEISL